MKVRIVTFGCGHNRADSAIMARLLEEAGFELVEEGEEVLVVNTCGVKGPTEERIIHFLSKQRGPVVVTGCLAERKHRIQTVCPHAVLLGVLAEAKIVEAVEAAAAGRKWECFSPTEKFLPGKHQGLIAEIPVVEGCLGACTFCFTRLARRGLRWAQPQKIREMLSAARGALEIRITGEDLSAYGGGDMRPLLETLLSFEGPALFRLGMMNPLGARENLDLLLEAFSSRKFFRFLHVPFQSGSERILRAMGRARSLEAYLEVAKEFRKKFPTGVLATDVICGFPGETPEDFSQTLEILLSTKPDVVNVSGFSPRPGTPAFSLPRLPWKEVKERTAMASRLARRISRWRNSLLVGSRQRVLSLERLRGVVGRTFDYRQVVMGEVPLGKWLEADISGATHTSLIALSRRGSS